MVDVSVRELHHTATALAHDLAVWTQDDDFEVLADLAPNLRGHRG